MTHLLISWQYSMTDPSASATNSTVTLNILNDYIKALLSTLDDSVSPFNVEDNAQLSVNKDTANKNTVNKTSNNIKPNQLPQLLWIVENKKMLAELRSQLGFKNEGDDGEITFNTPSSMNATTKKIADLSTLPELTTQPVSQRYQLACFWLPNLSSDMLQPYIPLLMRYRDLYAAHLLIALDSTLDLRAYGFTPLDLLGETPLPQSSSNLSASLTLWQFNLYDYKKLPNWLNADYWANPENWNKHRW